MSMDPLHFGDKEGENEIPGSMSELKKVDEEEDKLIDVEQPRPEPPQNIPQPQGEDIIDPLEELTKNNNIVPLLAVLPMIDLNLDLNGKPLLSKLCTLNIPLAQHLRGREINFKSDPDNRTALHEAIAADDTYSANWCLQNGIGNVRDNFGNTPILEAIKLGRKSCFLLCLQHSFYDSQAPHICATYNRVWELKVLHRMGYDVVSTRDSQHFTPLERAVANYAYDAAQYLSEITDKVSINYLATKTDSQGIIRTIAKSREKNSFLNKKLLPVLKPALALLLIYMALSLPQMSMYTKYLPQLNTLIFALIIFYPLMFIVGWFSSFKKDFSPRNVNIPALLGAPDFPFFVEVCPECFKMDQPHTEHCSDCGKCVYKLHFHTFACVNGSNQVLWFLIELFWTYLLYQLHEILVNHLKLTHFLVLNFSSNFFFGNAAIIEQLTSDPPMLGWFIFLKIFLLYQFFCAFQWLCMMVLHRTHREINNTQNYPRLYEIVQASDGSFKNMERKLMQEGCLMALAKGAVNVLRYFFRD